MRKDKKIVQRLENPKLRKVRYELRTLLRLEYEKRLNLLTAEWKKLYENNSLTYEERFEIHKNINMRREKLEAMKRRYPINCAICGDRMENLVWNPNRHQWRCVNCYEGAHKKYPEIYP